MLFNSPLYIFFFLPVVVLVYYALNKRHLVVAGKSWLVLSSLIFYGYWKAEYLVLIVGSMLVNFAIGAALQSHKTDKLKLSLNLLQRKFVLIMGVCINLGFLGYFKYADFLFENIDLAFGIETPMLELVLPLAISFFTFQQIAYLVDCYRAEAKEYDFLNYSLFVTFFPQLIAGPIVHHQEMMPQFMALKSKMINWRNILVGSIIFCIGLFKKVAIADTFAVWANTGFDSSGSLSFLSAWGASLSYTFQLYYDFSGYSDMAIGAALLFNIRLPLNFFSPYKACNIREFWRRWHMTLSRWLRDYLYIPLGGNRNGHLSTYINLFVTFLLGGLWHGAGWTFVLWGALHGLALCVHRLWCSLGLRMPQILGWIITFIFINITWVLFRAESMDSASRVLEGMFNFDKILFSLKFVDELSSVFGMPLHNSMQTVLSYNSVPEWSLFLAVFALFMVTCQRNSMQIMEGMLKGAVLTVFNAVGYSILSGLALIIMVSSSSEIFLYFNF